MATKERRKTPPGAPKYHRLTDEKRIIIEALRKEGCSKKHIAERVGCHPTTVWRELKRNVSKKGYRHKKAQGKANHRVAVKAAKRRRFTAEITGNLVTLAERMTRFVFFAYAATKEADAVASAVIGLLASLPKGFLKSLRRGFFCPSDAIANSNPIHARKRIRLKCALQSDGSCRVNRMRRRLSIRCAFACQSIETFFSFLT